MPRTAITQEFELTTRGQYTKVDAVLSLAVEGKELPSMDTLGKALERALAQIQQDITESYQQVPARV